MTQAADSLAVELQAPARRRVGEPVAIRLRVRNRTDRTLDLYLRGRAPTFDIVITGPDGALAWQRLGGEVIPAIVRLHPLPAGERLEFEAVWDQRTKLGSQVEPGDYTVRGLLLVEGDPLATAPIRLRIDPR